MRPPACSAARDGRLHACLDALRQMGGRRGRTGSPSPRGPPTALHPANMRRPQSSHAKRDAPYCHRLVRCWCWPLPCARGALPLWCAAKHAAQVREAVVAIPTVCCACAYSMDHQQRCIKGTHNLATAETLSESRLCALGDASLDRTF